MKKNLFLGLIALTALTVTGCSKDDVVSESPNIKRAIEFGTYVGRDAQSRAHSIETVAKLAEDGGFGVFAYYTDGVSYDPNTTTGSVLNYMNNQEVTSTDGTNWTYSPKKYWPNESSDKLTFFAYAPYDNTKTALEEVKGDPIINFLVDPEVSNQKDLLVADASGLKDLGNTTSTVTFPFKHVLSRVGFKVEAVVDRINGDSNGELDDDATANPDIDGATKITVQEVQLMGNFNTSGTINLNSSSWVPTNNAPSSYTLGSSDFTDVATTGVTKNKQQLNKDSEYMMIIPHSTASYSIRVKYTVTTTDSSLVGVGSSVVENDITSAEFPFTFDKGKAYNFVLHLGLKTVDLSATVDSWDTPTDHAVNVPLNTL